MSIKEEEFNEDYFNGTETGIRLAWGYGSIKKSGERHLNIDGFECNYSHKALFDKLDFDFEGKTVLDIGGAIGNHAYYGKHLGAKSWDVLDLNIDDYCRKNLREEVDNFFTGSVLDILPTLEKYNVIFTHQFLECIPRHSIFELVNAMNKQSNEQIHIISTNVSHEKSKTKYNLQPIEEWKREPFKKGTRLIDYVSKEVSLIG